MWESFQSILRHSVWFQLVVSFRSISLLARSVIGTGHGTATVLARIRSNSALFIFRLGRPEHNLNRVCELKLGCVRVSAYDTRIVLFCIGYDDDEEAHSLHSPELGGQQLIPMTWMNKTNRFLLIKKKRGSCST
jgi:hypothetical protein